MNSFAALPLDCRCIVEQKYRQAVRMDSMIAELEAMNTRDFVPCEQVPLCAIRWLRSRTVVTDRQCYCTSCTKRIWRRRRIIRALRRHSDVSRLLLKCKPALYKR